jgi:hypothetical protein
MATEDAEAKSHTLTDVVADEGLAPVEKARRLASRA